MPSRNFTLDELSDFVWDVQWREGRGKNRWSEYFDVVFKADDDRLYHVVIEEGNTEYQDYSGWDRYPDHDYGSETLECPEVELYETLRPVTLFRKVADVDAA